jgi:hypothetical protein
MLKRAIMVEPAIETRGDSASRDALLQTAKSSPEIASEHDKVQWLSLYADDAVVEDPVGTPPSHRGRREGRLGDELGRFYEAFIAPSGIEMVTRKDIVSDMHVFRAVDIHTTNLKTGLQMVVPANLLYEIVDRDGGLAIRRMQAHWEANRMGRLLISKGLVGLRTMAVMNVSMLKAFGAGWILKYVRGTQQGVGRAGRELVAKMAGGVDSNQSDAFVAGALIELPGGATASVDEFLDGCTKLEVRDLLASGVTVSGLATIEWGAREREAGFVAELDVDAVHIVRLRLFWER